jgi:hypothetical protein
LKEDHQSQSDGVVIGSNISHHHFRQTDSVVHRFFANQDNHQIDSGPRTTPQKQGIGAVPGSDSQLLLLASICLLFSSEEPICKLSTLPTYNMFNPSKLQSAVASTKKTSAAMSINHSARTPLGRIDPDINSIVDHNIDHNMEGKLYLQSTYLSLVLPPFFYPFRLCHMSI